MGDGGFIIPVSGETYASEVKLLAVDVYVRGIERDADMFQEVNRVNVILNGQVTHSVMLTGMKRERFISGWHWQWILKNPYVVADMSTRGQVNLLVVLTPRMEMKGVWKAYRPDSRFRAWTWPGLDGVDSEEPEWFEKWKKGEMDLPEEGGV